MAVSTPHRKPSPTQTPPDRPPAEPSRTGRATRLADRASKFGGARGNEVLTRVTATTLVLLLLAEGVTVLQIEGLIQPHMFIGLVLIPPVLLKLGSVGYRFVRYYSGAPVYREKGPPAIVLRLTAPVLVISTISLFATGVWLLLIGHGSDSVVSLHVASFTVWAIVFAIHFLAHAPVLLRSMSGDWRGLLHRSLAGAGARAALLAASVGGGIALAISLLGLITGWHGD